MRADRADGPDDVHPRVRLPAAGRRHVRRFLRALVTADWELNPLDELGLRAAIIEACRRRGIFAVDAGSLAVNALLLDVARSDDWSAHQATFQHWVDLVDRRCASTSSGPTRPKTATTIALDDTGRRPG